MELISEKISNKTYSKLRAEGLKKLIDKKRTNLYIKFLKTFLAKKDKILDLACGYGRITIPLSKQAYDVEGLDLSQCLIQDAKIQSLKNGLKIKFKVGNMKKMPYKKQSFDKILCLWSSFNHLLTSSDQITTLNEIHRVLKSGGIGFVEMVDGDLECIKKDLIKKGIGKNKRIHLRYYFGTPMYDYIHNKNTIRLICKKSKFLKFNIKREFIGGKRRLVIYLYR